MRRPTKQAPPTPERILDAASPLFYRRGLITVTVDEIAARAGLTKRTLYYHFPTKDELILSYLRRWRERTRETFTEQTDQTGIVRILGAFGALEAEVAKPAYRGCPFVNAVAELNDRTHPATALAASYKEERRAWFERLLKEDQVRSAGKLSRQVMTLWDGAMVRAMISGDTQPVRDAREAVEELLQRVGAL